MKKILAADDNPNVVKLIERIMAEEDYAILTASKGEDALSIAKKEKPDLILLDVAISGGWDVIKNLKAEKGTRSIPIILLKSIDQKDVEMEGWQVGVDDFITKPFNPARLTETIENTLKKKGKVEKKHLLVKAREMTRLAIVGAGEKGITVLESLLGHPRVEILGISDDNPESEGLKIAGELNVYTTNSFHDLFQLSGLELIIDTSEVQEPELYARAEKLGIEILSGLPADFMWSLIKEREEAAQKEKALVKELNLKVKELSIFNEMSRLATSSLDLVQLFENITQMIAKVPSVAASCILMYEEEIEKFVVRSTASLGEGFRKKVHLSLSDPVVEELMAIRGPLAVTDINQAPNSPLMRMAKAEGLGGAVLVTLMSKNKMLGMISAFSKSPHEFLEEEISILGVLSGQASIAIENANLYEEARKKQQLVEQLLGQVIYAQEEERKRISAEIHDTIAQSLVGILAKVQTCRTLMEQNRQEAFQEMDALIKIVGDSLKEIRQIIFELRPSTLDDLGLVPSIENYIKKFRRENDIKIDLSVNDKVRRLPGVIETAVYRMAQEALLNVKKHACASEVKITLNYEASQLKVVVADNGQGFDWDIVTEKLISGDSQGITGMRERISLLGGTFRIISEKGMGTMVEANILLPRS